MATISSLFLKVAKKVLFYRNVRPPDARGCHSDCFKKIRVGDVCEKCDNILCEEHHQLSRRARICHHKICNWCIGSHNWFCSWCHSYRCPDHLEFRCNQCFSGVCEHNNNPRFLFDYCVKCKKEYCLHHLFRCTDCGDAICTNGCNDLVTRCRLCDVYTCKSHLVQVKCQKCDSVEWLHDPDLCKSKTPATCRNCVD